MYEYNNKQTFINEIELKTWKLRYKPMPLLLPFILQIGKKYMQETKTISTKNCASQAE